MSAITAQSSKSRAAKSSGSVLLLGNYRATIACARALKALDFHVIVGVADDLHGGAENSRACDEAWAHPAADDPEALSAALNRLLARRPDISVVYPVAEDYVRFVTARRADLPAHVVYAVTDAHSVNTLLAKAKAFDLARDAGVPVAPYRVVDNIDNLFAAARDIGWPVVVKPNASGRRIGDDKIILARDADDLRRQLTGWPDGQPDLMVQRCVSGDRYNVYFAARHATMIRLMIERTSRTDRADGSGLAVAGVTIPPDPALTGYTRALVEKLGYNGIGCAQFMVDADGAVNFLEINPRIDGNHALAERAGLGLTQLAIALAANAAEAEPWREGQIGLRYVWTHGELGGLLASLRNGSLRGLAIPLAAMRLLVSALRTDMHLTWSWRDPRPTLDAYLGSLARLVGRSQDKPQRGPSNMAARPNPNR